ncbi:hypothetical protein BLNAU_8159 [Blattamonas nauphoetae]|uniref:Uncharacterized protein n=1 Tax=Blattamonas nauphoetae TaxID=2049346 RepID=A0ABQ9XZD7_9EUKA|nr:hypothetical protein BLNAU_8159 [Blattamonas nauphoetae]
MNQLEQYYKVLPIPDDEELKLVEKSKARQFMRQLPKHTNSLPSFLSSHNVVISAPVLHLLEKIFSFNPKNRPSALEILNHPFLSDYKGTGDESPFAAHKHSNDLQFPSDASLSLNYETKATHSSYKHLLFQEILRFRPRALSQCEYTIPEEEREVCELANPGISTWISQRHPNPLKLPRLPPPISSPNSAHTSVYSPKLSATNQPNSISAMSGQEEKPNETTSRPLLKTSTHPQPNHTPLTHSRGSSRVSTPNLTRQLVLSRSNSKSSLNSQSRRTQSHPLKQSGTGHRSTLSVGNLHSLSQSNQIPFNSSSQTSLQQTSKRIASKERLMGSGQMFSSTLSNSVPNCDS